MLNYSVDGISISINTPSNGLYALGFDGGTGKSYLSKLLKVLSQLPEFKKLIRVISYREDYSTQDYLSEIDSFGGKLLMIDRFDLFVDKEILNLIQDKECVTLMGLKNNTLLRTLKFKLCMISYSKDRIEVVVW